MQKNAKWFFIPFAMIIVSFVFWGIGSQDPTTSTEVVAEIGPYQIDSRNYWLTYERLRDFYRGIFKDQFTEELQKTLDLKNKALEEMVDQRILLVAAEEHGVTVTEAELQQAIMTDSNFMRDGTFDRNVYLRTLQLNRISPKDYERMRRDDLVVAKMRKMILEMFTPYEVEATGESPVETAAQDTEATPPEDPDVERQKQTAFRAFIEGYKRKLTKEGKFTLNLNVIS